MTDIKKSFSNIFSKIRKNELLLISLIVIFSIILLVSPFRIPETEQQSEIKESQIREYAREILPLAQGKQVYSILTHKPKNPQIMEVSLDPLDVKIGETQKIIVHVKDTDNMPITDKNNVQVTILTDNESTTIPFLLRRADGPDLVTIWEGEWIAEDTHNLIFQAYINAISDAGESLVELSFR